eukprot:806547-Ditylum_brightwellii.AAC.1
MDASQPSILSTETTKGEKWRLCSKQAFSIALPEVADQEIAVKAIIHLLVIACDSGDLGFLWV